MMPSRPRHSKPASAPAPELAFEGESAAAGDRRSVSLPGEHDGRNQIRWDRVSHTYALVVVQSGVLRVANGAGEFIPRPGVAVALGFKAAAESLRCRAAGHPTQWTSCQFRPPAPADFPASLPPEHTAGLLKRLEELGDCCFSVSAAVEQCLGHLLAEHQHRRPDSGAAARMLLSQLAFHLVRDLAARRASAPVPPGLSPPPCELIRKAIHFIERNLSEPLSVEAMAEACGLPEHRFRQRFVEETGYLPTAFLLMRGWSRPSACRCACRHERVGGRDSPGFRQRSAFRHRVPPPRRALAARLPGGQRNEAGGTLIAKPRAGGAGAKKTAGPLRRTGGFRYA